jgi:hypothetical protein
MIATRALDRADELLALLQTDTVPDLGIVDVGQGSRLPIEMAVRVTLTDLARLERLSAAGCETDPARWRQLAGDVEHLHRLIGAALRSPRQCT